MRYALVGGIGIPVNLLALALFLHLMGDAWYPLALALSFEISTTANFFLNQLFTYHEQKNLSVLEWVKRALKAQMTSLSAQALTYVIALSLKYGLHMSPYLASRYWYCLRLFLQLRHLQPLRLPTNANA